MIDWELHIIVGSNWFLFSHLLFLFPFSLLLCILFASFLCSFLSFLTFALFSFHLGSLFLHLYFWSTSVWVGEVVRCGAEEELTTTGLQP